MNKESKVKTSAELFDEVSRIQKNLKPMLEQLSKARADYERALSKESIAAMRITRESVAYSNEDGRPWFGDVTRFAQWATDNDPKRWLEWNGWLYERAEILRGSMERNPTMRWEDISAT